MPGVQYQNHFQYLKTDVAKLTHRVKKMLKRDVKAHVKVL